MRPGNRVSLWRCAESRYARRAPIRPPPIPPAMNSSATGQSTSPETA
jgi:hypothetical protein